jgi:TolB-like protein
VKSRERRAKSEELRANNIKNYFYYSMLYALCSMLFFVSGCGPKYFAKPGTDMSRIKGIAVLPFENFTSDENADEKIRRSVITELLSRNIDVVEPGEVKRLMKDLKIKYLGSLRTEDILEIARTLKVDAVMLGSVETYGTGRGVSVAYPEVTINLRLMEVSSGTIVWSIRHTSGGADFWTRHFGSEGPSLSEAAGKVVREALDTFFRF